MIRFVILIFTLISTNSYCQNIWYPNKFTLPNSTTTLKHCEIRALKNFINNENILLLGNEKTEYTADVRFSNELIEVSIFNGDSLVMKEFQLDKKEFKNTQRTINSVRYECIKKYDKGVIEKWEISWFILHENLPPRISFRYSKIVDNLVKKNYFIMYGYQ